MGIFVRDGDELLPMREQAYEAEAVLQKLLASYPGLLAGDENGRRRWVLVQREHGIADSQGRSGRWSLDHLFLDDQGVPTLVEVKQSSDTRLRREVVGQMLDYAANAVVYWDAESIRSRFEARCMAANHDPEEELAEFLSDDQETEAFWELVKTNIAPATCALSSWRTGYRASSSGSSST